MNILIRSTYYPANPPKDFNEWIAGIVRLSEQVSRVRYNEHDFKARSEALARGFGAMETSANQDFGVN